MGLRRGPSGIAVDDSYLRSRNSQRNEEIRRSRTLFIASDEPCIAGIDKVGAYWWLVYLKHDHERARNRREPLENRQMAIAGLTSPNFSSWHFCWWQSVRWRDFRRRVSGYGGGAILVPVFYECFGFGRAARGADAAVRRHLACHHHFRPRSAHTAPHYARGRGGMEIICVLGGFPVLTGVVAGS